MSRGNCVLPSMVDGREVLKPSGKMFSFPEEGSNIDSGFVGGIPEFWGAALVIVLGELRYIGFDVFHSLL